MITMDEWMDPSSWCFGIVNFKRDVQPLRDPVHKLPRWLKSRALSADGNYRLFGL